MDGFADRKVLTTSPTLASLSEVAEAALQATPCAILAVDGTGRIALTNRAAERLFDLKKAELRTNDLAALFASPDEAAVSEALETARVSDESYEPCREFSARRRDGSPFPARLAIRQLRVGDHRYFACVVTDLTDIQRLDRMKREFVSTVSHELRTPLTSIKGSLGLLRAHAMGRIPETALPLLDIAANNSDRLVRIINDLLDIEKIDAGKMAFDVQVTPLRPLLERVIQANAGMAAQAKVTLALGAMPNVTLSCDPDRTAQVLTNLVSNALKFSPEGECVKLAATPLGDRVRITVTDRGPGIPFELRDRIFQKFAQADSSDQRKFGGTGLGLSIAKAIVEAQGGEIGFWCGVDAGATFFVDLSAGNADGREVEA